MHRGSRCVSRISMRRGSTSTHRLDSPAKLAASGCAPPIPPSPPVNSHLAGALALVVLAHRLGERLVGSLHDALRADVDPRARGHLAEHHQALAIELEEVVPVGPVADEIGVGEKHPRRGLVRAEHPDRLARLDQERCVVLQAAQRRHDRIETFPVARRPADAAVHHQLVRILRDRRIEIVVDHPQRRFLLPALATQRRPARRMQLHMTNSSAHLDNLFMAGRGWGGLIHISPSLLITPKVRSRTPRTAPPVSVVPGLRFGKCG